MQVRLMVQLSAIHRHTGGLEICPIKILVTDNIHRHTGGLEMHCDRLYTPRHIHRHTGGLENNRQRF